jgi:hypothetical protein
MTVRTDYLGRYITVPVEGRPLRLWFYATASNGRYNLFGGDTSTVVAIAAEQSAPWSAPELDAVALRMGLAPLRDNAGYRLHRTTFPLRPGLAPDQAADFGREVGETRFVGF